MPFSFVEIEKRKSYAIILSFIGVVVLYFITAYLLLFVIEIFFIGPSETEVVRIFFPSFDHTLIAFLIAFSIALVHWLISTSDLVEKLLLSTGAYPIDPNDYYHQVLKNIIDEVSLATGGMRIEAMVIPSVAKNAFSIQDFSGRSIVGVTEGLLCSLNRAQLESVVAHEVAHIVSKDTLTTSVICSLAELHKESIDKFKDRLDQARGRGAGVMFIIFLILVIMDFFHRMLNLFLSRQREYCADAVAVRLCRNPLALAEALKLISSSWRGIGAKGEMLESIFIINPHPESIDEQDGLIADLFSTHPPVKQRIRVLLDMAHLDEQTLEANLKNFKRVAPIALAEFKNEESAKVDNWFIYNEEKWLGPLSIDEIKNVKDLKPDQWIRQEGSERVMPLYEDQELIKLFNKNDLSLMRCPRCKVSLDEFSYEGAPVFKCSYCAGVFVSQENIQRIMIRQDQTFSEDIEHLVKNAMDPKNTFNSNVYRQNPGWVLDCPKCQKKMRRQFFVYSYPVEIDRCVFCNWTWFDKQELEILQYIYQNKEEFLL
jgi:heat shock protein HtpX